MARSSAPPIVVWFDDDCGVCTASVRLLRRRVDATVTFRPSYELTDPRLVARASEALLVVGPRGLEEGAPAVATLLDRCGAMGRAASIVLGLPGIDRLAARVYRLVAANRAAISRRLGLPAACALPGSAPGSPAERNA